MSKQAKRKIVEFKEKALSKKALIEKLTLFLDEQFAEDIEKISISAMIVGTIETVSIV